MRVTYDSEADAAFIYLTPSIGWGEATGSRHFDLEVKNAAVTASLNEDGRLLGLELLGVSRLLTPEGLDLLKQSASIEES